MRPLAEPDYSHRPDPDELRAKFHAAVKELNSIIADIEIHRQHYGAETVISQQLLRKHMYNLEYDVERAMMTAHFWGIELDPPDADAAQERIEHDDE